MISECDRLTDRQTFCNNVDRTGRTVWHHMGETIIVIVVIIFSDHLYKTACLKIIKNV